MGSSLTFFAWAHFSRFWVRITQTYYLSKKFETFPQKLTVLSVFQFFGSEKSKNRQKINNSIFISGGTPLNENSVELKLFGFLILFNFGTIFPSLTSFSDPDSFFQPWHFFIMLHFSESDTVFPTLTASVRLGKSVRVGKCQGRKKCQGRNHLFNGVPFNGVRL